MAVWSVFSIGARSGRWLWPDLAGVKRPFSVKYSVLGLRKVRLSGRLPTRKLLDRHIFCYQRQSNVLRLLQETCR